jgi:hypothetical protein
MALTWRRFHGMKSVSTASWFLAAATSLAITACSSATAPDAKSVIFTDEPVYSARPIPGSSEYGFTIVATYFNQTRDTVFLETCGPRSTQPEFGVISAESQSSEVGYSPNWGCVGHDQQIAVGPGSSRVDTLTLLGPTARDGRTGAALGMLEGLFRLTYQVQTCRGDNGCPSPSSQARSNTFRVKLAG